ncbi:unnamed protein product [Vicia faba]|uniref:Uncharacterized protein n=1 Tax=Vicia faba TaxID=3906 RepID=A0AAV0YQB6_VICFA|nr:unnamed protein product [Vicia faba]
MKNHGGRDEEWRVEFFVMLFKIGEWMQGEEEERISENFFASQQALHYLRPPLCFHGELASIPVSGPVHTLFITLVRHHHRARNHHPSAMALVRVPSVFVIQDLIRLFDARIRCCDGLYGS